MLFAMSNMRGAIYFAALCFLLWLTVSHPKYNAPSKLKKLKSMSELAAELGLNNDEQVIAAVKEKRNKAAKKDYASTTTTILVFTASWADQCYYTYPIWVHFANRFSTQKVRFLECDASRFERLCHTMRISTSNMAN